MTKDHQTDGLAFPDLDEIPFVPAFDLLDEKRSGIPPEGIVAIGAALFALTSAPADEQHNPVWAAAASLEAINQRIR